jgi:glutathione S-transferase
LCEEMGLAHTFEPVSFPPDRSYSALNPFGTVLFSKTATCRCLNRSR